ncbi:MlaC/ttg2D family ABC transporter substrate-binding protein [Glaciimonas soli]|uniref:Phospholipid transport system substrate-binding protein n=1 Tax=Glaciimonas soli TaxID=2590999 RepID=A0A843YLX1_9BURK|nr:ABC transporter substrate-binding protein [Glaciimonas soli]MQR00445.1 hypothetical protein [Glaciimonas soli]
MNILKKYLAILAFGTLAFAGTASAQEAPDALIKRISQEVMDGVQADKSVQAGNKQHLLSLVQQKIVPYIDFDKMTAMAAARNWRTATPEQQKQLTAQFRDILIYTYSGALSQVSDQKINVQPLRSAPTGDDDAEVRTTVIQPRGEPIQLSYRLTKTATGWKIFDVNILGAWLVQTYQGQFTSGIQASGIDGFIKTLADKNKALAAKYK